MGRIKKFREESEVSSFRIPKIENIDERTFFRAVISDMIHELAWIRYSSSFEEEKKKTAEINIKKCNERFKKTLDEFISYYKENNVIQ